jgi:hypothetical protein
MPLAVYTSAAFQNVSGLAVAANASVEVRREDTNAIAAIFSDVNGATALGNPFTADSDGRFAFYAAGIALGYKITVTKGSSTQTLRHQAMGNAQYLDETAFMATDAELAAIGALVSAADRLPYFTGLGTAALAVFTAYARTLLDDVDAATARSTLTLGTADTPSFAQVALGGDPASALQAATKQYVDNLSAGLDVKASCRVATTANITLSGEQTIDGVLTTADRVLVKNQSTPAQNGIYVSAAGAWARAADMDNWLEVPGAFTFVEEGSTQADTGWVATANEGGTLGSTAITWSQFSGVGAYQALDAELTALAGLASAADRLPYFTGNGAAALAVYTAFARTLDDDADAPTARQTLGIVECIIVAASDETTDIVASTNKVKWRMPYAFTVTAVRASLSTAQPAGAIFTVDINEAGVSILSTKLTIDNTETTSTTAATPAVVSDTALADDAEMSIDVDQIGTTGARGLKVYLIGRKTA